jgi:hypothetical protein
MQATLRIHSFPLPLRRLRVAIVRFLRARLREESPVVDRLVPENRDRFGFTIRLR